MPSVYDSDNFKGRVNLAAAYISKGFSGESRTFDTCFEMHDGHVVAVALVRRAVANPTGRLATNLFKYIGKDGAEEQAAKYSSVPSRDLPAVAAELRREASEKFDAWMAERNNTAA